VTVDKNLNSFLSSKKATTIEKQWNRKQIGAACCFCDKAIVLDASIFCSCTRVIVGAGFRRIIQERIHEMMHSCVA
jgi:hypothetical protein